MELSSPNVSSNTVVYSGQNTPPSPKASFDYTADSSLFITYPSQALDTPHLNLPSPERPHGVETPSKRIPHSIVAHSPFGTAEVKLDFPHPPAQLHGSEDSIEGASLEASNRPNTPRKNPQSSQELFQSLNPDHSLDSSNQAEPLLSEDSLFREDISEFPKPPTSGPNDTEEKQQDDSHYFTNMNSIVKEEKRVAAHDSISQQGSPNEPHSQNWHTQLHLDLISERPSSTISAPIDSTRSTVDEIYKEPLDDKESQHPNMSLDGLETSFPSLPSSPMRKRYTNSPSRSISSHSDEANFHDSTFFNDTQAQFDLDIDLDDHKFTGETKLSPWRKIQPSIQHDNQLFSSKRVTTQGSIAEFSSTSKIEELSKQLTDCRIQIRLYEKFLQDLIDSDRVDINHLADFQEHFDDGAKSFSKLEREHSEICNLVEDLYASLEEYQEKWKSADTRAHDVERSVEEACQIFEHLLDILNAKCDVPLTEPDLFISEASKIISDKIEGLLTENEKMRRKQFDNAQERSYTKEKDLANANQLLKEKKEEADRWKNESIKLKRDFDSLRLDRENSTEMRLQEYQNKIDRLQREVENLSDPTRKDSFSDLSEISATSTRDREKYILLQRDYENLQRLSHDRVDELRQLREDYENKLASMNGSLSNRKRELINLRAELADTEGLQQDLETAVGKQRVLKSENFKLSWQLDSLNKDKAELQKRITDLNSKIDRMTVSEEPTKALVDSHFKTLLEADIRRFERIYNSLDLLAEEASLREPEQKIKRLVKLTQELPNVSKSGDAITTLKRDHKYVFDYFVRAIDAMVKEHIRILLESSENQKEAQLKEKVKELEGANAQLRANQIKNSEEEVSILKLRNQQLHDKWKYEREQRVHDNTQATERFRELEEEIRDLRKKIAK